MHAHLLGDHALLLYVRLDVVRLVRRSLLLLHCRVVLGPFEVEVALGLGLPRLRRGACDHRLLIRRGLGHRGLAHRLGLADRGVALGLRGRHVRNLLHARDVRLAHVRDVLVLVAHLSDGEAHHLEAHLRKVLRDVGAHAVRHHLRLLDDLFYCELADDSAQVPLHHEPDEPLALRRRLGQQLFRRGADAVWVALDLDLRHRLNGHGDALVRVQVLLGGDIEAHKLE